MQALGSAIAHGYLVQEKKSAPHDREGLCLQSFNSCSRNWGGKPLEPALSCFRFSRVCTAKHVVVTRGKHTGASKRPVSKQGAFSSSISAQADTAVRCQTRVEDPLIVEDGPEHSTLDLLLEDCTQSTRAVLTERRWAALKATVEAEGSEDILREYQEGSERLPGLPQPRLLPYEATSKTREKPLPSRSHSRAPLAKCNFEAKARKHTGVSGELLAELFRDTGNAGTSAGPPLPDPTLEIERLGRQGKLAQAKKLLQEWEENAANGRGGPSAAAYEAVIAAMAKHGDLHGAYEVHERLLSTELPTSSRSWHALILGYSQTGRLDDALQVYTRLKEQGGKLDFLVLGAVLGVLARAKRRKGRVKEAEALLEEALAGDITPEGQNCVSLIKACCRLSLTKWAERLFHALQSPSFAAWSALLEGYMRADQPEEAAETFWMMKEAGYRPGPHQWSALITALCSLGNLSGAQLALHRMQEEGLRPQPLAWETYIVALAGKGMLRGAALIMEEMQSLGCQPTAGVYSSVVAGHVRDGLWEDAVRYAKQMRAAGYSMDAVTGSALVLSCAKLSGSDRRRLDEASACVDEFSSMGLSLTYRARNCLVEALLAAGRHDEAEQLIEGWHRNGHEHMWPLTKQSSEFGRDLRQAKGLGQPIHYSNRSEQDQSVEE